MTQDSSITETYGGANPETAGRRCFYLLVIHPSTSAVHPLPEDGELTIGRDPEAALRIGDRSASRQHARIQIRAGTVSICDLESRNGTWVNGERQRAPRVLSSGDVVTIGTLTLVLHRSRESATESALAMAPTSITVGTQTILLAEPAMLRLYELLRRLARSDMPVLVTGETGSGKENAALALHYFSRRASGPLVTLNCAAIPETLVESELFGHERGAFTGAHASKPGRLEAAHGGTAFLDELGELPLSVQAKLLRFVETGTFFPVGGMRERRVDLRLVAATNRDLEAEVRAGRFRSDLFFRLATATVTLPPLRERPAEIPLLAERFLIAACAHLERARMMIAAETLAVLANYSWPGNVRELKNLMDYLAATVVEDLLLVEQLPDRIRSRAVTPMVGTPLRRIPEEVEALEARRMREALASTAGNQRRAAELIGMPLRTFVTKLGRYGLRSS